MHVAISSRRILRGEPNRQFFPRDYHLFCFWGKDTVSAERIQQILERDFHLLGAFRMGWSEDKVRENFARLYRLAPASDTGKQGKASNPPYWAWIVADPTPDYRFFKTNGELILFGNVRVRDAKDELRQTTGRLTISWSTALLMPKSSGGTPSY